VVIGARVGDVGVGEYSAGVANGGAEDGPEVVIGARVELGAGSGGVGGEKMALGAGAGAEWSRVLTGCIVGNCGGSATRSDNSATGEVVGVGVGLGGGLIPTQLCVCLLVQCLSTCINSSCSTV
jgi:hypothetical protein